VVVAVGPPMSHPASNTFCEPTLVWVPPYCHTYAGSSVLVGLRHMIGAVAGSMVLRRRSQLFPHLAIDEARSEPGIDSAAGVDMLALSFVAVVHAVTLDDRQVAI